MDQRLRKNKPILHWISKLLLEREIDCPMRVVIYVDKGGTVTHAQKIETRNRREIVEEIGEDGFIFSPG